MGRTPATTPLTASAVSFLPNLRGAGHSLSLRVSPPQCWWRSSRRVSAWSDMCRPYPSLVARRSGQSAVTEIPVRLHKSMTTSRIGCEQQIRTLPSAGFSIGSGRYHDRPRNQTALTVVTNTGPARPTNWYVARLGRLQNAMVLGRLPVCGDTTASEGTERTGVGVIPGQMRSTRRCGDYTQESATRCR